MMKLGFIGTGNMATAMMGGILANGLAKADEVIGADPTEAGRKRVQEKYGIHVTADNKTAAREAKILILSGNVGFHDRAKLLYFYQVPTPDKVTDRPFKIIHRNIIAKAILYYCLADIQ